jgi:DNA-binding beta-propeller fold protein YncE
MRTVSRRCCWCVSFLFALALLCICPLQRVHADGGAPNLAYVSGTPSGVSVIDVLQGKVTRRFSVAGDPHTILLSFDGRFLYATQPRLGLVSLILAATGRTMCAARIPGEPALLALDQFSNIVYAAGSGAARITALDATTCAVRHVFKVESPVYGMAVSVLATGSSVIHQLWVAERSALTIFDGLTDQPIGSIPIPGGPQYLSLPPGQTAYVTTRQGAVDAIDIRTRTVEQLLSGGTYGPMDYNEITGEIYVPDAKHFLLAILTPVLAGSLPPEEPNRVIHTDAPPQSVAITNDGSLGFIALGGGQVVMLDLLSRQVASTVDVGGTPHFVITGLYPPTPAVTQSKAHTMPETHTNNLPVVVACVLAVLFLILVGMVLLQRHPLRKSRPPGKGHSHSGTFLKQRGPLSRGKIKN